MKIRISRKMCVPLLIIVQLVFTCLPVAGLFPGRPRVIIQALVLLLYLACLFLEGEFKLTGGFILGTLVIYIFYRQVWSEEIEVGGFMLSTTCCLEYVTAAVYFGKHKDNRYISMLLWTLILLFSTTALTTILGLIKYPLAVRELGKAAGYLSEGTMTFYRSLNIANWGQMYGMVFAVGCILLLIKMSGKRRRWLLLVSMMLICEASIIFSQLTYAMILSVMIAFFIMWKPERTVWSVLFSFLIIMLLLVLLLLSDQLLLALIDMLRDSGFTTLSDKLNDMHQLLFFNNSVGDAEGRLSRYAISVDTFLKYPLLGRSVFRGISSEAYGHHSDFLDMLAFGGLAMLGMIAYFVHRYRRFIARRFRDSIWYMNVFLIGFLILFLINPVFNFSPIFAGAFLMPVLVMDYVKQRS